MRSVNQSLSLVTSVGGDGGFFASVLDIGFTGQQQQPSIHSANDTVLGGAGGGFWS